MGDAADAALEYFEDHWCNFRPKRRRTFQSGSGDYMWRTEDGVIPMASMSTAHLMSAMKVCQEKGNSGKYKQLSETLWKRGNRDT